MRYIRKIFENSKKLSIDFIKDEFQSIQDLIDVNEDFNYEIDFSDNEDQTIYTINIFQTKIESIDYLKFKEFCDFLNFLQKDLDIILKRLDAECYKVVFMAQTMEDITIKISL